MNIDFVFACEADLHGHAHKYATTHTCALLLPKRIWLCSPLCVSPPAWQMHLQSKSWWIFSLNSKSKPHFPSFLGTTDLHACRFLCLPQNSFIDKAVMEENIVLDSYLNRMLSLCDECEQHILEYMYSSYQMAAFFFAIVIFLTFLWQIVLQSYFLHLFFSFVFFSRFQFLCLP